MNCRKNALNAQNAPSNFLTHPRTRNKVHEEENCRTDHTLRLTDNACRIMSIIAVLRALESPHPYQYNPSEEYGFTPDKKIPADNVADGIIIRWGTPITTKGFESVLGLIKPIYRHVAHMLSFLPPTVVSHRANAYRDALFDMLGDEFTREQLKNPTTEMRINTEKKCLYRYIRGCGCKGAPQKCI